MVLQTRIFFSGQPLFSNQISEPDFSNQISWTTFLEPLFYTFLEKWLQIKWSPGIEKIHSGAHEVDAPLLNPTQRFFMPQKSAIKFNKELEINKSLM